MNDRVRLDKIWHVARAHMSHALDALPDPEEAVRSEFERYISEYHEFIDHNELECALDMLQEAGDLGAPHGGFWRSLERAAETMQLTERIPYFREQFDLAIRRRTSASTAAKPEESTVAASSRYARSSAR